MNIFDAVANTPLLFHILALLLGLLVGSFLNVVIYRLPKIMEAQWQAASQPNNPLPQSKPYNLIWPNSHCPSCGHHIRPWHNIPVLSYLLLAGKCAYCKHAISVRYPSIELITGLLSVLIAWHLGPTLQAVAAILLTWALICLTMIDYDHQLLPDSITLPFLWIGLLINSFGLFTSLFDAVWGAAVGYLSLWSVYWLFKLATGKEGMGYGDFKLLAMLGAWLGWQYLPLIILLSSLVGAVIGIILIIILGRDRNIPIPFGPYLAAAGLIALLYGEAIISSYLRMVGLN